MRYEPVTHVGSEAEVVIGLLREYVDIERAALLREHAKDRETARVASTLAAMGYELWGAFDSNGVLLYTEPWLYARRAGEPHGDGCDPPRYCACDGPLRVPAGRGAP